MKLFFENKTELFMVTTLLFLGISVFFYQQQKKQAQENQEITQELQVKKEEGIQLEKNLTTLSERYQSLYKEKNGTANKKLITAVGALFQTVYTYDTSKPADDVKERRQKAGTYAEKEALDVLFGKDTESLKPSVVTISQLEKEPEIFLKSSDSNELSALVVVEYTLSIGGEKAQEGHYMYKIRFDQFSKKVIQIENMGEITP